MIFYRISYRKDHRLHVHWERKESEAVTAAAQIRLDNRLQNGQVWTDKIDVPTLNKDDLLAWLQHNVAVGA